MALALLDAGENMHDDQDEPALIGNLALISLVEVLQTIDLSRRNARIDVGTIEGRTGTVFLEAGAIVHAHWDGKNGRDAFFAVCDLRSGRFCVSFNAIAPRRTVWGSTVGLLLEHAKRIDDDRALSPTAVS
jgi:hypothetical protein